mmetsp:Transcript_41280/g.106892  ORF Transcript_41280/g.106892 Transcript_41280/m.106892 type:complete len:569 (+) Transcript_41280:253-1959(+)
MSPSAARRVALLPLTALLLVLGFAFFTPTVAGLPSLPSMFRKGPSAGSIEYAALDYNDDESDLMDPWNQSNGPSRRTARRNHRAQRRKPTVTLPSPPCKCVGEIAACTGRVPDGWLLNEALREVCPIAQQVKDQRQAEYCRLANARLRRVPMKASHEDAVLSEQCAPVPEGTEREPLDQPTVMRHVNNHELATAIVAVRAASATLPLWRGRGQQVARDLFYTKANSGALRGHRHMDPFTRESAAHLPAQQPEMRYKTCAVVGNSGSLLSRQDAPVIDRNEFVMRLNQGPVLPNYAINTGEKTSARFLNRKFTQLYGTAHKRLLDVEAEGVTVIASQAAVKYFNALGDAMHSNKTLLFANSELVRDSLALLETFRNAFAQGTGITYEGSVAPSTGFLAIQLASQMCEKVTAFGMSLSTPEPGCRTCPRHQYFDPRQHFLPGRLGPPPVRHHQQDIEGWVLKAYHVMGISCLEPPPKGLGLCGSRLGNLTSLDGGIEAQWPSVAELVADPELRALLDQQPPMPPTRTRQHETAEWVATPGYGVSRTVRFQASKASGSSARRRSGPIIRTR